MPRGLRIPRSNSSLPICIFIVKVGAATDAQLGVSDASTFATVLLCLTHPLPPHFDWGYDIASLWQSRHLNGNSKGTSGRLSWDCLDFLYWCSFAPISSFLSLLGCATAEPLQSSPLVEEYFGHQSSAARILWENLIEYWRLPEWALSDYSKATVGQVACLTHVNALLQQRIRMKMQKIRKKEMSLSTSKYWWRSLLRAS